MKIISIGSSKGCNIYIDADGICKRHALIYIQPSGKMQIVDTSENGTFINGARIKSHVATPVKRRDIVTFANGQKLDWHKVPDPSKKVYWVGATLVICLMCVAAFLLLQKSEFSTIPESPIKYVLKDTCAAQSNSAPIENYNKKEEDTVKADSLHIPSAEELWVGSGKQLRPSLPERKMREPKRVSTEQPADSLEVETSDTIVEETPSAYMEFEEIEETSENE